MTTSETFLVPPDQAGATLAAVLRRLLPGQSWTDVRRLIQGRRVKVLGEICLDSARRLKESDPLELLARPAPVVHRQGDLILRFLDAHVVVVEKPPGISTVRHPLERDWPVRRKALSPTLEDWVPPAIAIAEGRQAPGPLPRLRVVQRLDKETSGLVVFARTVQAERGLGKQFSGHTVTRRYLAIVPGRLTNQVIATRLVRDRGDGRRGSTTIAGIGKEAITHVELIERLNGYSLVACRLETGRTHQIRIHLAERGHPVCGDKVYCLRGDGSMKIDHSGAPRLALHAALLGFRHPVTGKAMEWEMPLPADLLALIERLRGSNSRERLDGNQVEG
jgi:23S rRNA pseudouridine1911/1915/1917 synthase